MNLEEAYALRRREVLALTIENKKLKSGAFFEEKQAAYEKEIRKLQQELIASRKQCKTYAAAYNRLKVDSRRAEEQMLLDFAEERRKFEKEWYQRCVALEQQVAAFKSKVAELTLAIEQKDAAITELENSNGKLSAQINRNYENSSIPSSQKPLHKKISNNREATGRKPGAQVGHEGHKRKALQPTEAPVLLEAPKDITADSDYYPTGKFIEKQIIDIELNVIVNVLKAEIYRSRSTGKRIHAKFPAGIDNEVNYGPSVKALAFLLNNYCNVSIAKTTGMIKELSNGTINISTGAVNKLVQEFSKKTETERKAIFDNLVKAEVLYTDATGARVNGKGKAVMVCTTPKEVLYFLRDHKGHEGIKNTPVEFTVNTLVHDHDLTFYNYGGNHQECLAHILRYLLNSIENEPELTWNKSMHKLLQEMIHTFKESDCNLGEEKIQAFKKQYNDILLLGNAEYLQHPPAKWYPEGKNLLKRLVKHASNTLLFLEKPNVEYTNNNSERACRKFKRHLQSMVTFRSQENGEAYCNCLGILETARLNGDNLFLTTKNVFENGIPSN